MGTEAGHFPILVTQEKLYRLHRTNELHHRTALRMPLLVVRQD